VSLHHPAGPTTLLDCLLEAAQRFPDKHAFVFLSDGEAESERITFKELDRRARAIAAQLKAAGEPGERVLILYPPGLDFISAFFGCIYADMIAVPATPPQNRRHIPRLEAICRDAQARFALAPAGADEWRQPRADAPQLQSLQWITPRPDPGLPTSWRRPEINGDSLAFLQYTSGATSAPKGVMVSHANILSNLGVICAAFQLTAEDVAVFWLPVFHDMGLIGGVLSNIYLGARAGGSPGGCTFLFPPSAFVEAPVRWLNALTRQHATVTGAPNFAYDYCLERITEEQRAGLDLSALKTAFCGAEPVRLETLDRFARRFASNGFRREAFHPVYGLAENTLIVTHGRQLTPLLACTVDRSLLEAGRIQAAGPESRATRTLVGCGRSPEDQRLLIVDPQTFRPCPPERVGEIWLAGPSVARGYWNKPDLSREVFQARPAGGGSETFLRTGDLGFLQAGELYITGRLRDLIILRGRNFFPEDLELTAEASHAAIQSNASAAFTIEADDKERLVIALELQRAQRHADVEEVAAAVRGAIAETYGLETHTIAVLRPGGLPRTTSGKIQRTACREKFLSQALEPIGISLQSRRGPVEAEILRRQAQVEADLRVQLAQMLEIPLEQVDLDLRFQQLGLGSLHAVALKYELEEKYGIRIPAELFTSDVTLAQLVAKMIQSPE
jgi:acyl-CoA synthetase (AMP-forming)/AMP-acid ligase II/acyl carrier protein